MFYMDPFLQNYFYRDFYGIFWNPLDFHNISCFVSHHDSVKRVKITGIKADSAKTVPANTKLLMVHYIIQFL